MMIMRPLARTATLLSLLLMIACTPGIPGLEVPGPRATTAEAKKYLSGNSFRTASFLGDLNGETLPAIMTEMYFSPNGYLYAVGTDAQLAFYGRWGVIEGSTANTKGNALLMRDFLGGFVEGSEFAVSFDDNSALSSYLVFLQADGSVVLGSLIGPDAKKGVNLKLSKPVKGFPLRKKYNKLMLNDYFKAK